jgi:hypothetical protein
MSAGTRFASLGALMRTEEEKDRAENVTAYVFVAGVVIGLISCAIWTVTGNAQPAVRIFTTELPCVGNSEVQRGEYQPERTTIMISMRVNPRA